MVRWEKILETGRVGVDGLKMFSEGVLNIEDVQLLFRNRYPEASGELRRVIRERGAKTARTLARKALRRRNLV
jgi:hypothetical protein